MKSKFQIYVNDDSAKDILEYSKKNKINRSQSCRELIRMGKENIELKNSIDTLANLLYKNISRIKLIETMLIQLYSDMQIDVITNPRDNKLIKKIIKDFNMGLYDEE